MKTSQKTIISCAVTGSVHTPSMSRYLPITPDQIVESSIGAAAAGASIIHLHARNPIDGSPTADPSIFAEFLSRIKQQTDAVINITTGGSNGMSIEDRIAAAKQFKPEIASLNMGTMNFDYSAAAKRVKNWQYEWEEEYVNSSSDRIALNTRTMIVEIIESLAPNGTRFEFECYDVGHLYMLADILEAAFIQPPLFIQCIFGVLGGIGADISNLIHMRAVADQLFGDSYYLSVIGAGKHQMRIGAASLAMGGNARVGLEDGLNIGRAQLAETNAQQVQKLRTLCDALGAEIATPTEARDLLDLKGGDKVAF